MTSLSDIEERRVDEAYGCGSGTCIIAGVACTAGRSGPLPPTVKVQQVEGEGAD